MTSILNKLPLLTIRANLSTKSFTCVPIRLSSFKSSPFVFDLEEVNVQYETTRDPEEWKFVERILPPLLVPKPKPKAEYPSEWKPQSEEAMKFPYFIPRNKNYMIPVYMRVSGRGQRRHTYVKKIQGDIWLLESELKEFLQKQSKYPIRSQVNELVGQICFYGDHVNAIKYFLIKKNL